MAIASLVAGWWIDLRPTRLGGPATYVLVRGTSMEPTYHTGDLVIVRRQPRYRAGEVAAFRIPAGHPGAGRTVIHRVLAREGDRYVMQGDNRGAPDRWHPTDADMAGTPIIVVPRLGVLLTGGADPVLLGLLAAAAGGLVVFAGFPAEPRYRPRHARRRTPREVLSSRMPSSWTP